jgi:RimJ/RimL family protein N-acetyltransferase
MGLSDIDFNSKKASVFILIGEDNYREKGVGTVAMNFLIKKAFNDLKLKKLVLEVNKFNVSAITLYKKIGFKIINKNDKEFCMTLMRSSYA